MATKTKQRRKGGGTKPTKGKADQYAFPDERKEPLNDAKHVRNAVSRFDQVEGVSDKAKDRAWRRIKRAAKQFNVSVSARSWRDLGSKGRKQSSKQKATSTAKQKAGRT